MAKGTGWQSKKRMVEGSHKKMSQNNAKFVKGVARFTKSTCKDISKLYKVAKHAYKDMEKFSK